MKFNVLGLNAAAAPAQQDFAVAHFHRLQRNKHAIGGGFVLRLRAVVGLGLVPAGLHDANDLIIIPAHADVFAQRGFHREQQRHHLRAQHANARPAVHVVFREEATADDAVVAHGGIPRNGADNFAIHTVADVPDVVADVARRQDDGDTGDGFADALRIVVGDAVLQHITLAALIGNILIVGRFAAPDDDVLAAQTFDLFLRLVAGAFADGEHGDNRAHAKHNAQHGEQRAQAMQPEAADAQSHRPLESRKREFAQGASQAGIGFSVGHQFQCGRLSNGWCGGHVSQRSDRG